MSFHLINTIARYEMRTLLRSWFFRIFALLAIVGLGIFNIAMNIEASGAPWIYKALSASIPYANLIILNLGQAIVAVFLASEFLKQDKKNDTVEVIYARSMSNGQYMLGKTLGILAVFLVLNLIVLAMGIGFSFMSSSGSRNILSYFMYPLLISLPTLVFILGLSFFVMVLIKNQAITFILLLGYIALTIFYLNKKLYHILDYIAYNIPMMYSNISGFANFSDILYHRLVYFLLGIGFIFLAVYRLPRLPQPHNRAFISLIVGLVFILAGGSFAYKYLNQKNSVLRFRQQALALNNLYSQYPMASVKSCNINLEHAGNSIAAEADLEVTNENEVVIDTLILSLNPSLNIKTITINHKNIAFTRKMHLVFLKLPSLLKQGQNIALKVQYSGKVDERICFLDQTDENATFIFNLEVFTFQKRYAFLDDNYVCLTSESMWYPSAWTGYASAKPFYYARDMINFGLKVKTNSALTAISQGKCVTKQKGIFTFEPEHPMPKISLIIGDYEKRSIKVDSVEYLVYTIKGHGYLTESFKNFSDTIPKLIKDLKNDYETQLGMRYPYTRFMLTEVPVHFCLDKHEYTYTSDAVQPEMVLSPEMGVMFSSSNFGFQRYRIERNMKRNNEEALPEEISARLFRQFIQNNFTSFSDQNYPSWTQDENTFSVFPLYYGYVTPLDPKKWPVLLLPFDAYYQRRYVGWAQRYGYSSLDDISQRMDSVSLKESLAKDVVLAKGYDLFSILKAQYGIKEVDSLFSGLLVSNTYKKVRFEEVSSLFKERLHANIDSIVESWYLQKHLPAFIISNISSYKVVKGEEVNYQVRFVVTNTGMANG
ncbi:MAG TPA: ABC transporter permease, partial [Bacteroidales bacterium]|nr:ABC transporter permease [Bacteroidales bacterium]